MCLDAAHVPPPSKPAATACCTYLETASPSTPQQQGETPAGREQHCFRLITDHELLQPPRAHNCSMQPTSSLPSGPRKNFKAFRCSRTVLRSLEGPSPCALSIICSKRQDLFRVLEMSRVDTVQPAATALPQKKGQR